MLIIVLPDVSGSYGRLLTLVFVSYFISKTSLVVDVMLLTGEIKRICETNLGIVSQCCQPRHVSKCNKQYLENLSLKINVKVCFKSRSQTMLFNETLLGDNYNAHLINVITGWRQE